MSSDQSPNKRTIEDLALFGGAPLFAEARHVGRPNVGNRERFMARMAEMLDRNWLTNKGPFVTELEAALARFVGVKHCICMCNGTVALEIACRALGLRGEVIVPSFTFVATAHALQWQEITPVFCDIDLRTHCIDPAQIERHITPRTTGIVAVHTWGHACDVEGLIDVAQRRKLSLLFDAAHAFGCSHNGQMIGGFGRAEVFSFHATKFFNTFEGGAVATNDDELAAKIRLMKNFGFAGLDRVIHVGTNGKMSEASAAMGLTNLESLPDFVAVNRRNYERYRANLSAIAGMRVYSHAENEAHNYQYVIVEVEGREAGVDRDLLVRLMHAENVLARRYFYPACHRMEPYRSYFPHSGLLLPHTERLTERVMSLPNGTAMDIEDVDRICSLIAYAVEHSAEIKRSL